MKMSLLSRKEYMQTMSARYRKTKRRTEKSAVIDEIVSVTAFNRKYVLQQLNGLLPRPKPKINRVKPLRYMEATSVIQKVWRALDYPCAERLHPVLLEMAEKLHKHGHLCLSPLVRSQLSDISRATLGRRLSNWLADKPAGKMTRASKSFSRLRAEIPVERYDWNEKRPGALEIDLVEHNGGSSLGQFAYTLSVVDIVTGYSRRRAVLGRSQLAVFQALQHVLDAWPMKPWGIHSDNGSEFMSNHLRRFCKEHQISFSRSRPYRKNDNAHVEQKNRQYVREVVGYERYDSPQDVAWLNAIYACLDEYANHFLPMRKVISKERISGKIRKRYDTAKTPLQRLIETNVLEAAAVSKILADKASADPLLSHQRLEKLVQDGPALFIQAECTAG